MADHAAEVRASGGVEQLRDFGVAKGLLGDALDQVAELEEAVAARDAELEKVRRELSGHDRGAAPHAPLALAVWHYKLYSESSG